MTRISEDSTAFTVVTRLKCRLEAKDQVADLARRSLPIFRRQAGFVSLAHHESADGTEIMTYLQWTCQADHEACLKSKDFAELSGEWEALIQARQIEFKFQAYRVVAVLDA